MSSLILTAEEQKEVKDSLLKFVRQISNAENFNRKSADIAILPAITEILLWKD